MKKIILIVCLLAAAGLLALAGSHKLLQGDALANNSSANEGSQVIAYYFHGNFRCSNCLKIEQYSREAIEQNFKNELDSGKLVFKVINVEDKGNEHFMNDYQLYTKSLVITLVKDGKEIKYENLKKVWEYLNNQTQFHDYVKANIEGYLKEL
jgi:hypothetical protein